MFFMSAEDGRFCMSVCLSFSHNREPHKVIEPIEVLFGVYSGWLKGGGPDPPMEGAIWGNIS